MEVSIKDKISGMQDDQGANSSCAFDGSLRNPVIAAVYGDSARYFADITCEILAPGDYNLIDFGSHKGELLNNYRNLLPNYNFVSWALDREQHLAENVADHKVAADLTKIPVPDNSFHLGLARYILHQNPIKAQRAILAEINRVAGITIVQHVGADSKRPVKWKRKVNGFFQSGAVPVLTRDNNYFSTSHEVEEICEGAGIKFKRLSDKKFNGLSTLLRERYPLTGEEFQAMREAFGEMDYIVVTTWLIGKNLKGKYTNRI